MADWPPPRPLGFHHGGVLSTGTALLAVHTIATASAPWPAANRALFVPVRVPVPVTVRKLVVGAGATASGNFDIGIYDSVGNRLVSSGATAKGASTEHVIDVTDTQIGPGLYYLAQSVDGTGNYFMITPTGGSPGALQKTRLFGCLQMASAYPLPDPATFAPAATIVIPSIAAYLLPY